MNINDGETVRRRGNAYPRGHQVQTSTLFPCDSVFSFLVLEHETISSMGKSRSCNVAILWRIQRETDAKTIRFRRATTNVAAQASAVTNE